MKPNPARKMGHIAARLRLSFAFLLSALLLAGCALKPESEAIRQISDRAAELQSLPKGEGKTAADLAQNLILLDPEIKAEAARLDASIDQVSIARAAFLPSLSLSGRGGLGAAGAGDGRFQFEGDQLLFDFGKTKRSVNIADIDVHIAHLDFQMKVDEALVNGLALNQEVKTLEETVDLRAKHVARMEELRDLISARVDSGTIPTPDLLETETSLERRRYEQLETELELHQKRDQLARISGIETRFETPKLDQSCKIDLAKNDQLIAAKLRLSKAMIDLENANKIQLPRFSLAPLLKWGSGGLISGIDIATDAPIFQGGAISAKQKMAQNNLETIESEHDSILRDAQLQEDQLNRDINIYARKREMLTRQIQLQKQIVALYRSQYIQIGAREITDVLDAEAVLYDREVDLLQSEKDLEKIYLTCASLSKSLRPALGISEFKVHQYPLNVADI